MESFKSIDYNNGKLKIIDQLLLPFSVKFIDITNANDGRNAIKQMQVRGAPAIAIVGCLSVVVEIFERNFEQVPKSEVFNEIRHKLEFMNTARPTAVNLTTAINQITDLLHQMLSDENCSSTDLKTKFIQLSEEMLEKDISNNLQIGRYGHEAIVRHIGEFDYENNKINILTHCNTGSLATAGYGTALGVIRFLHTKNVLKTRPYLQGARLTSFELLMEKIPSTLIADNMVAMLFERKQITAVIVGADRIAVNGDTANKIGTYQIAILARFFNIKFFVAAPTSTIDRCLVSGNDIRIEERSQSELKHLADHKITLDDINCWNPAFDITPCSLITAFITENGVISKTNDESPKFIF